MDQTSRRVKGTRDSELTRKALMEAALGLFGDRGFDGVSTDEIAQRAHVNKAMISYHFGGKLGLYRALFSGFLEQVGARLREVAASSGPDDEVLAAFVATFAGAAAERPAIPRIALQEAMNGGRHLEKAQLERMLGVFELLRGIIERGVANGVFRPVDPLLTHLTLLGSIVFFFASGSLRSRIVSQSPAALEPPSVEAFTNHLQDLMTRGLIAAAPRS